MTLRTLHDELTTLEHDKRELSRQNRERREDNDKLERRLALLDGPLGEGKRWRWYSWLAMMMLVITGAVGLAVVRGQHRKTRVRKVALPPPSAHPRLLVTSNPPNAQVTINNQPVGKTPLLRPLRSKRRRLVIEISGPGLNPHRAVLTITRQAGGHIHADLLPCSDATGASCATGRTPPRRGTHRPIGASLRYRTIEIIRNLMRQKNPKRKTAPRATQPSKPQRSPKEKPNSR
jgi:hypothetical protein